MTDDLTVNFKATDPSTSSKIVGALMFGFPLNESLTNDICADQCCNNINLAITKWLKNTLIINDIEVGHLLMPLITQRFNEYINQVKRSCSYE